MSLVVWFPLNNNVNNQGTTTLSMTSLSGSTLSNTGKVTRYCYGNTSFTGGGYVSSQQITLGQNQSIFAWVKFSSLTSDSSLGGSIAGQHRYPSNVGMGMTLKYVSSTTGYLSVNTGNGSARTFNTYCGSTLLQANTWYHLGYTYDGSTIRLYVNGVLDGSHSFTGMSTPADYFMIGCWSFSGSSGNSVYGNYKLNGYINDLRAYNHTLSIKEIKELAKGLALHYKFNFEDLYVPVEYIQGTGTQWIQTGLMSSDFSSKIIKCDISFYNTASSSRAYSTIIGCQQNLVTLLRIDSGTMKYFSNNGSQAYSGSVSSSNNYTVSYTTNYNNNTTSITVNGTTTSASSTASWGTNTVGIMLFASHNGGSPWTDELGLCRIYYCKFYDNDKLVRNFIPCIRKCDSKPGLFDLVNNVFYTNSGTGEFTYPSTTITTTIPDASGFNNAIAQTNTSASNTTNIGNQSISFTGSSSYLRLAHEVLNGAFSVSVWAKTSSTSNQCLFCDRGGTGTGPALFLLSGNSVRFDTVDSNFSSSFSYGDGNWHLYTCVYDGTKRYTYVDGALKNSVATTSIGTLGAVLTIGGSYASSSATTPNGNYFNGQISDWKLYNTALTQADITELYKTKESIDKNGNLYCNSINELGSSMSFKKNSVIECNSITEGFNKTSLQGAYTQLEYIKTNGNQIINTGVADTLRTTVDLDMQVDSGIGQYWYGSTQNSGSMMYNGLYNITALEYNWLTISRTSNNRCIMTQRLNGNNITITMNGVTSTVSVGSTAPTGNLYIFGCNNGNRYYGTGILCRYFRIYQDNVLVRDFIPVKRNKDNAIGMLDLVHNTFYANAGTGSFTAGNEINKKYAIYTNNIIEN